MLHANYVRIGIAFALLTGACNWRPTLDVAPSPAASASGATTGAKADRAKEIASLIDAMQANSGEAQAKASRELVAIGADAVPALEAFLVQRDAEAAAAAKDKQWDITKTYVEGAGVCRAIGEPCHHVLVKQCQGAQLKGLRTTACSCASDGRWCKWSGQKTN